MLQNETGERIGKASLEHITDITDANASQEWTIFNQPLVTYDCISSAAVDFEHLCLRTGKD